MRQYPKHQRHCDEPHTENSGSEYSHYEDTGCEVSPSCLRCPLPQCKYDDPVWYQSYRRRQRDQQILEASSQSLRRGEKQKIALQFGVSVRTFNRARSRAVMGE